MLPIDITIDNDATTDPRSLSLVSIADRKSVRSQADATVGNPFLMTVSHQETTRGKTAAGAPIVVDRHLIRLDRTKTDSLGVARTGSVQLVIEAPREVLTHAEMLSLFQSLKNLLYASTWSAYGKLLNNEP